MHEPTTASDDVRYEMKTVQAVRGMENKAISTWEQQGWEVVSRSTGLVRTEITLRRAKRPIDVRRYAGIAAAAAVVTAAIVAVSLLTDGGDNDDGAAQSNGDMTASPAPTSSTEPPVTTDAPAVEDVVLTAQNDPGFAAVLAVGDSCDPSIAPFVETHRGRTISFAGSVVSIQPHGGTSTRFDILLGPGDEGAATTAGPAFQFRDENTTSDLGFAGDVPDSLGAGTLLDVTAELVEYDPGSCLLHLEPVETRFR